VFVIFVKKLKHDKLEKFWLNPESNGWGNGVGRSGGEAGMVGTVWSDIGISVDEGAAEDADPVRDAAKTVWDPPADPELSSGATRGCRLCGVQSEPRSARVSQFKDGSKNISKAAGCVR
jgi:hypothetical protein